MSRSVAQYKCFIVVVRLLAKTRGGSPSPEEFRLKSSRYSQDSAGFVRTTRATVVALTAELRGGRRLLRSRFRAHVVRRSDKEVAGVRSLRRSINRGVGVGRGDIHAVRGVTGGAHQVCIAGVGGGQYQRWAVPVRGNAGQPVVAHELREVGVSQRVFQAGRSHAVEGAARRQVLQLAGNTHVSEVGLRADRVIVVVIARRRSIVA